MKGMASADLGKMPADGELEQFLAENLQPFRGGRSGLRQDLDRLVRCTISKASRWNNAIRKGMKYLSRTMGTFWLLKSISRDFPSEPICGGWSTTRCCSSQQSDGGPVVGVPTTRWKGPADPAEAPIWRGSST